LIPCAHECKQLWNPSEYLPEDPEGSGGGPRIPTMRSWVGLLSFFRGISSQQAFRLFKGIARIATDAFWILFRQAVEWEWIWIEGNIDDIERVLPGLDLSEGTVDLNIWLKGLLQSDDPLVQEYLDICKNEIDTEKLIFEFPAIKEVYDFVEAAINPDMFDYLWAAIGFSPLFTIPAGQWLDDATGYLLEPGIFGSEFIDDVLSIIFPIGGIIDTVQDITKILYKGIAFVNQFYHGYNVLRSYLLGAFSALRDEGLPRLLDMIDQDTLSKFEGIVDIDEIYEYISSRVGNVYDWVDKAMPEFPEFSQELLDRIGKVIDRQEFSLTDPASAIRALFTHFGLIGDAWEIAQIIPLLMNEWEEFYELILKAMADVEEAVEETPADGVPGEGEPAGDGGVIPMGKLGGFE
jgi:hypothetical protein